MEKAAYEIDLSMLTAADVADLLAADSGDIVAADRLMRLTVKPPLKEIPLVEWNKARKAMVQAAVAALFRSGD